MKKNTSKILIIILFLAGFSLLLYPFIANEWNRSEERRVGKEWLSSGAETSDQRI